MDAIGNRKEEARSTCKAVISAVQAGILDEIIDGLLIQQPLPVGLLIPRDRWELHWRSGTRCRNRQKKIWKLGKHPKISWTLDKILIKIFLV